MATIMSTYLFYFALCLGSVYLDQNMQTGILGHTSLLDRAVSSITRVPGLFRALPAVLLRKMAVMYRIGAANLADEQERILELTHGGALVERKRYQKGLMLLSSLDSNIKTTKPAEQELLTAALELVRRLPENIFLTDLIINHELEPEDKLADLLEDYYDGLLVEERRNEDHVSWEEVKARLDAKHNLG